MSFSAAEENFHTASRQGIDAQVYWPGVGQVRATELVLRRLLPMAREGLESWGASGAEIDRFLGIIEQRCLTGVNGAEWFVRRMHDRRDLERWDGLRATLHDYRERMHQRTRAPGTSGRRWSSSGWPVTRCVPRKGGGATAYLSSSERRQRSEVRARVRDATNFRSQVRSRFQDRRTRCGVPPAVPGDHDHRQRPLPRGDLGAGRSQPGGVDVLQLERSGAGEPDEREPVGAAAAPVQERGHDVGAERVVGGSPGARVKNSSAPPGKPTCNNGGSRAGARHGRGRAPRAAAPWRSRGDRLADPLTPPDPADPTHPAVHLAWHVASLPRGPFGAAGRPQAAAAWCIDTVLDIGRRRAAGRQRDKSTGRLMGTVVVGYVPKPEGEAALHRAVQGRPGCATRSPWWSTRTVAGPTSMRTPRPRPSAR